LKTLLRGSAAPNANEPEANRESHCERDFARPIGGRDGEHARDKLAPSAKLKVALPPGELAREEPDPEWVLAVGEAARENGAEDLIVTDISRAAVGE